MSRIAFAWELGGSFGHISVLLPFARKLVQRGHDVSLALHELHNAGRLLGGSGLRLLQAPVWVQQTVGLPEPPLNYSEILMRYGYLDAGALSGLVAAWRALFELLECDLVVAEHAPTALLAARSMGLASAALGPGFNLPPRRTPMPNMRPWLKVTRQRLKGSDATVLGTMNAILAAYGVKPLDAVSELFEIDGNFLCTFAELDHYPQRGASAYWGPCYDLSVGQEIVWPAGAGQRVFVYLETNGRDFEPVMDAVTALGLRAIVCAPGIVDGVKKKYESPRVVISSRPFRLDALLRDCDLVVGYGGHGLTAGVLMAGVPLLLLPTHLERFLLASRVAALGAGLAVNPEMPMPDYAAVLSQMLGDPGYREQARRFARKYAAFDQEAQQEAIAARIEEIAARGKGEA